MERKRERERGGGWKQDRREIFLSWAHRSGIARSGRGRRMREEGNEKQREGDKGVKKGDVKWIMRVLR